VGVAEAVALGRRTVRAQHGLTGGVAE